MMWTPEDFAILRVGDDLDEAVVRVEDGGLGVARSNGNSCDLDLVALFLRLRLREADAADLRVAVGAARDAVFADRASVFTRELGSDDDPFHRADVGELRQAGDNISNSVDTGFRCFHPLVDRNEAAVELDVGFVDAGVISARAAADGDEDLFGFLEFGACRRESSCN